MSVGVKAGGATPRSRETWAEVATYVLGAAASLLAAAFSLRLWSADLRVPFAYSVDALSLGASVKGMLEGGSFVSNPMVGAPGTSSLLDFPGADGVHIALLRAIGLLARDWALTINLYYLLGFVLVTVTSIAVLRALRVSRLAALVVSVLYALLPYHLVRGEHHLFLASYWMVPLAVLVCVWIAAEEPPAIARGGGWRAVVRDRRAAVAVVICVLIGAGGVYYAYFSCFLLLVAAVSGAVRHADRRRLVSGLVLVAVVAATVGIGVAESVAYRARSGPNPAVAQRWVGDAEIYALRIPQLLLPASGHRSEALAGVRERYRRMLAKVSVRSDNENDTSSLGMVFGGGFLALLGFALWRPVRWRGSTLETVAVLNLAAVLLGTVAGIGFLVAMLAPQIRAYNRISIFIAFFCAVAVATGIDRLRASMGARRAAPAVAAVVCAAVLAAGLWDQPRLYSASAHGELRERYLADRAFVARVEEALPAGGAVFQLPYMAFPEGPPVNGVTGYEHFRGYLHSTTTRWSFGAIEGREDDAWQKRVAALPPAELVAEAAAAGFDGVWVDTRGYADGGASVVGWLLEATGGDSLRSDDGRIVFVPIDR